MAVSFVLSNADFPPLYTVSKIDKCKRSLDDDLTTVNNFFAHRIKEIDITKYGTNDTLIIPTTIPQEIYRYSESMLKHLPKKGPENDRERSFV